jgi:hypothetical protein
VFFLSALKKTAQEPFFSMDEQSLFASARSSLTQLQNIRSLCIGRDPWPDFQRIVFVPAAFEQWTGGGFSFDPKYSDRYPDGGPVSLCSQYLTFVLGRNDKPDWLNEHKLEFIDLRHGANTLYFFQAPSAEKRAESQASQVFKLAGQELPPELFALVSGNLDLYDTAKARITAKAAENLALNEHVCKTMQIDFDLHRDSSAEARRNFESRTFPLVRNLLKECGRAGQKIKQVVINPVGESDTVTFFDYVVESQLLSELMIHADELVFTNLDLSREAVSGPRNLLRWYPNLKLIVQRLFMTFRAEEIERFEYKDRVFVHNVRCSPRSQPDDVLAITSNPVQSFQCRAATSPETSEDEDEDEDEEEDEESGNDSGAVQV